jgi:hypothetical protein
MGVGMECSLKLRNKVHKLVSVDMLILTYHLT